MTKNNFFKTLALSAVLFLGTAMHAQVKVGDNPTIINPNSILEMESTNKGMLLPRLQLNGTTIASPLTAHVAGMTVYNTATAGDVTPGFYYNDGTKWVRIASPTAANNTTAANLITITNGTGATLTAMTVGVDTTALKSFLNNKITVSVAAPLTGNGTAASPLGITQNNTSAGQLITVTNGTGASFTAMTVGVDTTALKTFIAGSMGKTTSAGSLIAVTNGAGAALKDNTVAVDTTALKTFLNNKIQVTANAPLSGLGTSTSPLAITTGDLTAGSLLLTTGTPTAALLKTAGLQVDTTALKTFLGNKVTVATSAPITGDGTTANPISVTRATATNGVLTTVTNGANATFTALQYDVDTTALKTFLTGKLSSSTSAPITGDGTTANPISVTRATATNGVLTTVTNGANATFTALQYDVDTTALKTFINGRTTNTLTNPTNTITSTVNGVAATAPAVNTVSNTFVASTRALTTTVNGVSGTAVTLTDGPDSTTASNGLTMTGKDVRLGGTLIVPTTVTTDATNTLSLAGLQQGTNADSIVVASGATGTLKKVPMNISRRLGVVTTASTTYTIPDSADVVIYNGASNTVFTLPSASASYGRELRILNYAAAATNTTITLSSAVIVEGNTSAETETVINSKDTSADFPLGMASRNINTITLISNGTSWYKLGN